MEVTGVAGPQMVAPISAALGVQDCFCSPSCGMGAPQGLPGPFLPRASTGPGIHTSWAFRRRGNPPRAGSSAQQTHSERQARMPPRARPPHTLMPAGGLGGTKESALGQSQCPRQFPPEGGLFFQDTVLPWVPLGEARGLHYKSGPSGFKGMNTPGCRGLWAHGRAGLGGREGPRCPAPALAPVWSFALREIRWRHEWAVHLFHS